MPKIAFVFGLVLSGCTCSGVSTSIGGDGGKDAGLADGGGQDSGVDAGSDAGTPERSFTWDLDRDGKGDTNLAVGVCDGGAGTCLGVDSKLLSPRSVRVLDQASRCGYIEGLQLNVIGNHQGDALSEVSLVLCADLVLDGGPTVPQLAVVDVSASTVVGRATAPPTQRAAYVTFPKDPAGALHPLLAPPYADGADATAWGELCLYRPDLTADARCGPGFVAVATRPQASYFREVGGYLQDLDGDGWEDLTLLFHSTAFALSPATRQVLSNFTFDVAIATEPNSPPGFHSGRNYGTHLAMTGADGKLRTVMVGGAPIGSFTDAYCNVSRFVGALDSTPGQPSTRRLAWSRYFGFNSTIFSAIDPSYAADPSVVVARPPDHMNNCVHRFSDSASVMDGVEVVIVDYFVQDAPIDLCQREQYQLYLPPTWTDPKQVAWNACINKNLKAPGRWGMQVFRATDGMPLTGSLNNYIWGMSSKLLPGGERVYLVELLPGTMPFDLSDRQPTALAVRALVNGLWADRGTLPVAARPTFAWVPEGGPRGVGSSTSFIELMTTDRDGDGLDEVLLEGGRWVGWSAAASAFVLK